MSIAGTGTAWGGSTDRPTDTAGADGALGAAGSSETGGTTGSAGDGGGAGDAETTGGAGVARMGGGAGSGGLCTGRALATDGSTNCAGEGPPNLSAGGRGGAAGDGAAGAEGGGAGWTAGRCSDSMLAIFACRARRRAMAFSTVIEGLPWMARSSAAKAER
jgi:hypothetical protein